MTPAEPHSCISSFHLVSLDIAGAHHAWALSGSAIQGVLIECALLHAQELELLKMLNFDSRIVQLYGACILEGCPVVVLEFMGVCSLCP